MSYSPGWTDQELNMINVVDVFQLKPVIMKKAEGFLNELKYALVNEITQLNLTLPPLTDFTKGQIARGENYKGFPFISLDMPQRFSKTEIFTYRTVFWWGHCLIFSFIFKGGFVPLYCQNLTTRRTQYQDQKIYLATSHNPFEWELNEKNYKVISELSDHDIQKTINETKFIKLACFYPLTDRTFKTLDWKTAGLNTFRAIAQIVLIN